MPTLARFANFVIAMYFEDHNPPHVYVVGRTFEMLVDIRDGSIYAGEASPRARQTALRWIAQNRAMLLARWNEYR
jgi:phosphomannomutase